MRAFFVLVMAMLMPLPALSAAAPGKPRKAAIPATYTNDVRPLLSRAGCNSSACHGARAGKGGFVLSLFGGDADADYDAITRVGAGRRINKVDPAKSLLLTKAASVTHAGSAKVPAGSAGYEVLLAWLRNGALRSEPNERKLVEVRVAPQDLTLKKGELRQLSVTAVFSDGLKKDVTRDASYSSSDEAVATIEGGRVSAKSFGESAIGVSYLRMPAVARVAVPQPLAGPFPALRANNRIDELVYAKQKRLGIPPSPLCSEAGFVRRAYLDVIGTLPTSVEARAFLGSRDTNKRAALIDSLLEREEYADFWALKWSDLLRIKSEYPVRVWPKAVAVYYRWVRESVAANKPYDWFVRELLTGSGSNFRSGPANFMRAHASKDPQSIGEAAALLFLGARLGCARCHAHPTEKWTSEDDLGFGAFFSKVKFKGTHEWKEEIVYSDANGVLKHPRTKAPVAPRLLNGQEVALAPGEDPRVKLADWMTSPENQAFSRNIVNRVWFWLLGTGIVEEPDDMRPANPPENPELLDYLASELVSHKFDLKHIFRLILNSRTYQLSSTPNQWNAWDTRHFSHYAVRRMTAEQVLDAISQVTATSEKFSSKIPEPFSFWPSDQRAIAISDGNTECSFLDLFGRSSRDTPYESDRNSEVTMRQVLYLLNSEQLAGKLSSSPRMKSWLGAFKSNPDLIDEAYLTVLSRFPSESEKRKLIDYMSAKGASRSEALQDAVWALVNTKEFLFAH